MQHSPAIEQFIKAFTSHGAGCRRTCACGQIYYDYSGPYDWEPGELEELTNNPKAHGVDFAVGTLCLDGGDYVEACMCWHPRATEIIQLLRTYQVEIGEFYELERTRLLEAAARVPQVTKTLEDLLVKQDAP